MKPILIIALLFNALNAAAQGLDTTGLIRRINGKDTVYIENPFSAAQKHPGKIKYVMVDHMQTDPEFTGDQALFIKQHLRYPEDAKAKHIKGTVLLYVHVDKNGKMDEEPYLVKQVCPSIDREAIRIAKLMPAFKPGKIMDKPAATTTYLRIPFE